MEGERFPQKPIGNYSPEAESAFDDLDVSIEEIEDTPEMKQIAGYLDDINETAVRNIFLQELRKSLGTTGVISCMNRFIPKAKIIIEKGKDTDTSNATYNLNKFITLNAYKLSKSASTNAQILYNDQHLVALQNYINHTRVFIKWNHSKSKEKSHGLIREMIAQHIHGEKKPPVTTTEVRAMATDQTYLDENEEEIRAHFDDILGWIKTVHSLIHEELHAITDTGNTSMPDHSHYRALGLQVEREEQSLVLRESDQVLITERYITEKGRGINEAITQLISLRMARTYLTQCPRNHFENTYLDSILHETKVGYTNEMCVAEQYIAFISAIADIPEEVILNSVFKEYVQNGTYLPNSFVDILSEHMPNIELKKRRLLVKELQTQLSVKSFSKNSAFYEAFQDLITQLPEHIRVKIYDKLARISEKYFGDPEDDSEIIESEEKTE